MAQHRWQRSPCEGLPTELFEALLPREYPRYWRSLCASTQGWTSIAAGMGEAFGALMRHAGTTGAQFAGPPFTRHPEMPGEEVTFLVGMPVAPGAVAGDGVELEELPAVEAATLLYKGPYDAMKASWRRLMDWVRRERPATRRSDARDVPERSGDRRSGRPAHRTGGTARLKSWRWRCRSPDADGS